MEVGSSCPRADNGSSAPLARPHRSSSAARKDQDRRLLTTGIPPRSGTRHHSWPRVASYCRSRGPWACSKLPTLAPRPVRSPPDGAWSVGGQFTRLAALGVVPAVTALCDGPLPVPVPEHAAKMRTATPHTSPFSSLTCGDHTPAEKRTGLIGHVVRG